MHSPAYECHTSDHTKGRGVEQSTGFQPAVTALPIQVLFSAICHD